MFRTLTILLIATLVGCAPATNNETVENAPPAAAAPDEVVSGGQTIVADGFRFELPAGWTAVKVPNGVGLGHPSGGLGGISLVAVDARLEPATFAESLLDAKRRSSSFESETQIVVAGRNATRIVTMRTTQLEDDSQKPVEVRSVFVIVPLEATILQIDVRGVNDTQKQQDLESIVSSIQLG